MSSYVYEPDNRFCVYFNLFQAATFFGIVDDILSILFLQWYYGFMNGLVKIELDILVVSIFLTEIVVSSLLIVGAHRKNVNLIKPWIIFNFGFVGALLVLIVLVFLLGFTYFSMDYWQMVLLLLVLAFTTGFQFFGALAINQLRRNLNEEINFENGINYREQSAQGPTEPSCPPKRGSTPPPSYEEVSRSDAVKSQNVQLQQ